MKLRLLPLALLMSLMMSPTIGAPNLDPTPDPTVDPEPTEPEPTEPEPTEPESTEPESTDPEPTEPEPTEPEPTEPESTEPESTEPESTDPEPTEPDEESVSNIIAKANKEIESAMTEGDMKTDGRRNALGCRYCKWPKSGSYVYIYYSLSNSYNLWQKYLIRFVMNGLERKTCIRFRDVNRVWWWKYKRHLYIYPGTGCWSYVGRVYYVRRQYLSLAPACLTTAIIQHELFHALGFTHEHSRSDRDYHVTVHYGNIQASQRHNFNKHNTNNLYTPYDFNSVMQYHNWAWSTNGWPTLTSKINPRLVFGFAKAASNNDILRVNRYYQCSV